MTASKFTGSEKLRIIRNVTVICAAFMIHFTAFHGTTNLQGSLSSEGGLDTASSCSIYAALGISNIFLTVPVLKWLGSKWTLCVCFSFYIPYIAAQVYPSYSVFIPTSLMVGIGGGPLWCGQCTYFSTVADVYSELSNTPTAIVVVRFFGIFYMAYRSSQIWGNLISWLGKFQ